MRTGSPGSSLFEHAPLLIEALEPFPQVRIVLSTAWVPVLGYEVALSHLPHALRHRVIGATFDVARCSLADWSCVARGYQIVADVQRRKPIQWVAIDDDADGWPEEHWAKLIWAGAADGISRLGCMDELTAHLSAWLLEAK
jgi:hypothetical protein